MNSCWAHCTRCEIDFRLPVMVPCPIEVYIVALKKTTCPECGAGPSLLTAYSPGLTPALAARWDARAAAKD